MNIETGRIKQEMEEGVLKEITLFEDSVGIEYIVFRLNEYQDSENKYYIIEIEDNNDESIYGSHKRLILNRKTNEEFQKMLRIYHYNVINEL